MLELGFFSMYKPAKMTTPPNEKRDKNSRDMVTILIATEIMQHLQQLLHH